MKNSQKYLQELASHLQLLDHEADGIAAAAAILAQAQNENRLIHVFGTEPATASLVTEIFFKPGVPMNINPILDPSLDPAHGAYRSAMCMELDNLSACILDYYEYVEAGEPIVLIGSNPKLPMFADALEWSKVKGLKTIAIVCADASYTACDADITLHTHGVYADTLAHVEGVSAGGEQTALTACLLNMLVIETLERLHQPAENVWSGEHTVDLQANATAINERLFRIRHL